MEALIIVMMAMCVGLYFLPTVIAFYRNKANKIAIFVLNFLLGWSVVGWVVALVWALSRQVVDTQPAATV
jgi:hypothetical protein